MQAAKEYKINYSTAKTIFRLFRTNQLKDDLGEDMPTWKGEAPQQVRPKHRRIRCLIRPAPQDYQEMESTCTPPRESTEAPPPELRLFKSSFRPI